MTVSELRTLVDNLDEYIHIPGGIDRLKKMVLHLAVSGQLVPQDPFEGTGEDLYREIQDEKEVLVRQGRIKKQKTLPEINSDATPFVIPESWKWTRLANVTIFSIGRTPSRSESRYWNSDYMPWVSIADLRADGHIGTTKEKVSKEAYEKCFGGVAVPAGSLLYSFKLTIGKMSIIDMDAVHNEAIASFATINPIFTEYLFKALGVIDPTARTNSAVMGKTLNSATLSLLEIPLPPLGEQKRIVAKVDSIFALINQLAEAYKSEQTERSKLVASSLSQLARGDDGVKDSLALTHLPEIIRTKADAKVLRQTILHLAVSGQLVPQDPSEGSGEELYRQIQAEKLDLIKQGKIKKQKTLSEISEDEVPFVIPENWKWVRFPEIYNSITPVTKLKTTDYLDSGKYPIIDQGQRYIAGYTNNGELNIVTTPVTIFGDHTREIKLIDFDFIVGADGVKILEPILVNSSFFYTLVDVFRPQSRGYGRHFKMLNDKIVPLPPLDEQKRIVAKTTQLLDPVVELERHLEK